MKFKTYVAVCLSANHDCDVRYITRAYFPGVNCPPERWEIDPETHALEFASVAQAKGMVEYLLGKGYAAFVATYPQFMKPLNK